MAKLSRVMIECFVDGEELSYEFMIPTPLVESVLEDYRCAVDTQTSLRIDSNVDKRKAVIILSGDLIRHSTIDVIKGKIDD